MRPGQGKAIWNVTWRVLVCLLLLGWIFHLIFVKEARAAAGPPWEQLSRLEQWKQAWMFGPGELWRTISMISRGTFALSVLLMGLTLVIGIIRWRIVLGVQGFDLSWSRTAEISFVAHFFNSFLLGSTGGDLMKAYYAARETHHKKTEAVVTVFVDRLLGLWAMLLFAGLMMLPNWRVIVTHQKLSAVCTVVLGMLAACTIMAGLAFWGGVSRAWGGARHWLQRLPKGEWLQRSLDSCRQFGKTRFFIPQTLGISMLLNAVCVMQVWVLAIGLNLQIPPMAWFVIVPSVICIASLPITPSGLGVRENLFVLMLSDATFNVNATSALSLSLLAYAGSLFWSLVGGVVYMLFKERHHLKEAELTAAMAEEA